jgi:hypothetical protein
MIRQDYLLREIERIVEFALRAMGIKQAEDPTEFVRFLRQNCANLTGVQYETLLDSSSAQLVSLLYQPNSPGIGRLVASGTLLCEAADVHRLKSELDEARELFTRGAEILAFTAAQESGDSRTLINTHLLRLHERIHHFHFPPEEAPRLAALLTPPQP